MDDEIDLGRYATVLLRAWPLLVLCVAGGLIGGVVAALVQPQQYDATALVSIVPPQYALRFDERIVTARAEESVSPSQLTAGYRLVARSDAVVAAVREMLPANHPRRQSGLRSLGNTLEVEAAPSGNILQLLVSAESPDDALFLANAWAGAFTGHMNTLYREDGPSGSFDRQVAEARERYQQAQDRLVGFQGANRIDELNSEITLRRGVISGYLFPDGERSREQRTIGRLHDEIARAQGWLVSARALQDRVENASGSAAGDHANAIAFTLLQAQVTGERASSIELQLAAADLTPPTARDVELLIATIASRGDAAEQELAAIATGLAAPGGGTALVAHEASGLIDQYRDEIRELTQELERAHATQRELRQARDVAWEAYDSLSRKAEEQLVAASGLDRTAWIASPALDAKEQPRRWPATGLLGGFLGLLIGASGALLFQARRSAARVEEERGRPQPS